MRRDLLEELAEIKGFSRRSLYYVRNWISFWTGGDPIVHQAAAQLAMPENPLIFQIP